MIPIVDLEPQLAEEVLRSFIFHERHSTEIHYVPHRIPGDVAKKVIVEEVKFEIEPESLANACNVVRFYRLTEALDHLGQLVPRGVKGTPDIVRALECIRLLGDMGSETQQALALTKYTDVLAVANPSLHGPAVTRAFFHLGDGVDAAPLEGFLKRGYENARAALADQEAPTTEVNLLEDLLVRKLTAVREARESKRALVGMRDEKERAKGLAKHFFGMTEHARLTRDWAGYALIGEAGLSSKENVVDAIRQTYEVLRETSFDSGGDEAFVEQYLLDCAGRFRDGVVFFGGQLTAEETRALEDQDCPANLFTPSAPVDE